MWIIGIHVFTTTISAVQLSWSFGMYWLLLMTFCLFKQEHAVLSKLNFSLFLIIFLIGIDKAHHENLFVV